MITHQWNIDSFLIQIYNMNATFSTFCKVLVFQNGDELEAGKIQVYRVWKVNRIKDAVKLPALYIISGAEWSRNFMSFLI